MRQYRLNNYTLFCLLASNYFFLVVFLAVVFVVLAFVAVFVLAVALVVVFLAFLGSLFVSFAIFRQSSRLKSFGSVPLGILKFFFSMEM